MAAPIPRATITEDGGEEPGLMDAALAHLANYGVLRLQPDQVPQAPPVWLAPRAKHEMDQCKDYITGCCACWNCVPAT